MFETSCSARVAATIGTTTGGCGRAHIHAIAAWAGVQPASPATSRSALRGNARAYSFMLRTEGLADARRLLGELAAP
jgi:hypothetical protein